MKLLTTPLILTLTLAALTGCSHTFNGMKQDIHEDTAPAPSHRTVIVTTPAPATTTTTVVHTPSSGDLPTSPPPLQNPSQ